MLISHSHQQKPSLRTIYGYLSYYLIEPLTKKLFPDWTDPFSPGLPMLERLLQILFQLENIVSRRLGMTDVLHKVFLFGGLPVPWSDHIVEYIFRTGICIDFFSRMFCFLVLIDVLWNLDLGFVVDKRKRYLVDVLALCLWHFIWSWSYINFTLLNVIIYCFFLNL